MTKTAERVWRVERALRAKVGDRATEVLHNKTRHLADLSPHEVAQAPSGDRIVLAELVNIVLQARVRTHKQDSQETQNLIQDLRREMTGGSGLFLAERRAV